MSWRFINLRSIDSTSSHTTMQATTRGGVGGLVGSSHADLGSSKLIQVVFLYCYGSSLNMKVTEAWLSIIIISRQTYLEDCF